MTKNYYALIIDRMSDQQLSDRYIEETQKLKMLNRWQLEGSHGSRPCGYPNTSMMNACRQELSRRGLAIPHVDL